MEKKKLPRGVVQFEGAPLQKRGNSAGPGGRRIPKPSNDASVNNVVRRDPPGVVRSGNLPQGKVAYEAPMGRRGARR